jgi:hypothetical protein
VIDKTVPDIQYKFHRLSYSDIVMLLRASPVLENGHGPYEQLPKSHGTNMEYDGLHSTPDLERLQKSSLKNILVKLLEQQKKSVIRLKARLFFDTYNTPLYH